MEKNRRPVVPVSAVKPEIGIAEIGVYEPAKHELRLANEWFQRRGAIGKRFAINTGVQQRGISFLTEKEMVMRAIEDLQRRSPFDVRHCTGIVLSSCSLVPETADWRNCVKALGNWEDLNETVAPLIGIPRETLQAWDWSEQLQDWEGLCAAARLVGISDAQMSLISRTYMKRFGCLEETAQDVAAELGLSPGQARGVNSGCSGYVKGWEAIQTELADALGTSRDRFILLLTASRHSKFIDFAASDTGALFGDFATATLVTYTIIRPVRRGWCFVIRRQGCPGTRAFARGGAGLRSPLRLRAPPKCPSPGARRVGARDAERVCWTMDGPGVIYAAGPAFFGAMEKAIAASGVRYEDIAWCLGHQPGEKMSHRASVPLRERGYRGELPTGLTRNTGNITCSSIPHALHTYWQRLNGIVACPAMGMHAPGSDRMSQGCLLFEVRS